MNDEILRPPAAAKYLGNAEQTLARWRHEGVGPRFVKIGRLVGYRKSDLERWIASRERSVAVVGETWAA
jgi:predicted DNA-binding transcriptional regulator AlpA